MSSARIAPFDYTQGFFLYTAATKILDASIVFAVWQLTWWLRFQIPLFAIPKGLPPYTLYSQVTLPLVLVFSALFHMLGAYRADRIPFGYRAIKKIIQGSIVGTLLFVAVLYFQRQFDYSRMFLGIFVVLAILGLTVGRFLLALAWRFFQKYYVKKLKILLIGSGDLLRLYHQSLESHRPYPIEWVGYLGVYSELLPLPYLGKESQVLETLARIPVDTVVLSETDQETSSALLAKLCNTLVTVKVIPDFGKYNTFTYRAEQEWGVPLLLFNQTPMGASDRVLKRILDIIGAIVAVILFLPVFIIVPILIRLSSKGAIFYSQKRVGADEKEFTLYKFRTMKIDAESQTGAVWATQEDPRTTSIGRWLRKTSLDELPQLLNVLKGDMSLVGPRPERPVFVKKFREEIPKYPLRHKMKSGMTGWAQINGFRGNTSLEERIKYDLFYIGHWSLGWDLKILILTFFKGFVSRHAY